MLSQAISIYVEDATMVASRIHGDSSDARDLAARFRAFAADGQAARAAAAVPAQFRVRFERMTKDCQSCHAMYNN